MCLCCAAVRDSDLHGIVFFMHCSNLSALRGENVQPVQSVFILLIFTFSAFFLFNLAFGCGVTVLLSEYGVSIFFKVILSTFWGRGNDINRYLQILNGIFLFCVHIKAKFFICYSYAL